GVGRADLDDLAVSHHVEHALVVVERAGHVLHLARLGDEAVVADDVVGIVAAGDRVGAGAGGAVVDDHGAEPVVDVEGAVADDPVGADAAGDEVVAGTARDEADLLAALERIGAGPAIDHHDAVGIGGVDDVVAVLGERIGGAIRAA